MNPIITKAGGMNNARPKSTGQVRTIYGEAKRRGLDNDELHELVASVLYSMGMGSNRDDGALGGRASKSLSSRDGAGQPVETASATPPHAVSPKTVSIAKLSYAEAEMVIQRLKGNSFVPLRTLQHRRQRAGVKQIVTHDQEVKIAALASQRNWSVETLINFCKRQCGHYPLRTTVDANKVIEALKAMNERDDLWAA